MGLKVIDGAAAPRGPGRGRGERGAAGAAPGGRGPDSAARPVDSLIAAYLLLFAIPLVLLPGRVPGGGWLAATHFGAAFLLMRVARRPPRSGPARWLFDLYPVAALLPLYAELGSLTQIVTAARHDVPIAALEALLFGGQPSQTLRGPHPGAAIDQYLHFCYWGYYFVPASLALWLRFRRETEALSRALTTTLLAFLTCAVVFVLFPVAGPYHHFGHPALDALPWGFPRLAHAIVQRGSSIGTAFPSSHTAVAVAVWIAAWRLAPPLFWAYALLVPGLIVGTVWGGFHYAVDAVAGCLVGAAAAYCAGAVERALGEARREAPPRAERRAAPGFGGRPPDRPRYPGPGPRS